VSVPLVRFGTPHSLSRKRVCPSPGTKEGGGSTLVCGCGGGGCPTQFGRLEKKLSTLSTMWSIPNNHESYHQNLSSRFSHFPLRKTSYGFHNVVPGICSIGACFFETIRAIRMERYSLIARNKHVFFYCFLLNGLNYIQIPEADQFGRCRYVTDFEKLNRYLRTSSF